MERSRFLFQGKVSVTTAPTPRAAIETGVKKGEEEKPIYWARLNSINREVFGQVLDIYSLVYNKNNKELIRPGVEELHKALSEDGHGYVDWDLLGHNALP